MRSLLVIVLSLASTPFISAAALGGDPPRKSAVQSTTTPFLPRPIRSAVIPASSIQTSTSIGPTIRIRQSHSCVQDPRAASVHSDSHGLRSKFRHRLTSGIFDCH
jgi:hypothetical protein